MSHHDGYEEIQELTARAETAEALVARYEAAAKLCARCEAEVVPPSHYAAMVARHEAQVTELRAALSGRTVSCICGGAEVERLRAERDEWRTTAQALRAHEAQIGGILMDVDWEMDDAVLSALSTIDDVINGPGPTSVTPREGK